MEFCGPLVNSWLDHCWTVLDSWVIGSFGFQVELFVSLPCSEGLEWVVSLEISAGFIGWKFGWLEIGKNGRFTGFKSPRGRIVVYAMPTPVWILHKQSEYPWLPLHGATCWLGVFLMLLMNFVGAISACNVRSTKNMTKKVSVHVHVCVYMRAYMCRYFL